MIGEKSGEYYGQNDNNKNIAAAAAATQKPTQWNCMENENWRHKKSIACIC